MVLGDGEQMLTTKQAAPILGVSVSTLERWRFDGEGPPPVKLTSRTVRYKRSTIEQYRDEHERH